MYKYISKDGYFGDKGVSQKLARIPFIHKVKKKPLETLALDFFGKSFRAMQNWFLNDPYF